MNNNLDTYKSYVVKMSLIFLIMGFLYFLIRYFLPLFFSVSGEIAIVLLPFLLAGAMAILIDPIVDWLVEKKRIKRGIAVAITLSIVLLVILLVIIYLTTHLVIELSSLYKQLIAYANNLLGQDQTFFDRLRYLLTNNTLPVEIKNTIRDNLQVGIKGLADVVSVATNVLFGILTSLPSFVTIIIVSGLATFFISRDKKIISNLMFKVLPQKCIKPTRSVINELSNALIGFFRAQAILISITGFQTVIGLYILGVNYALTLGLVVGIFDLLPVLGPGTILIPWSIFQFVSGNVRIGVGLLIIYAVIAGVRQIIEPKILSQNIGIHPLATIASMYIGVKIMGGWGIILGPVLFIIGNSIIKAIWQRCM